MNKRRQLLTYGLATVCGPALSSFAFGADPVGVAIVYIGPPGDAGWSYSHELAVKELERRLGTSVKVTRVENVPESAEAERVYRQLAARGNRIIIGTAFGYMNAIHKVARDYPKVTFLHCLGYVVTPSIATYIANLYEGAYLCGAIGAAVTKTKTLGFIGAVPIPDVFRTMNAFAIGARKVDPSIVVKVVWVNAWHDPGKERQAAVALIDGGADVLLQDTNSTATISVAQERGVHAFGWNSDMSAFGPQACLASIIPDWSRYYEQQTRAVLSGEWKSQAYVGTLANGMVDVRGFNTKTLSPKTMERFKVDRQAIIDGKLDVFAGPLKDTTGKVRAEAGGSLDAMAREKMDWTVEGIVGAATK